jgi:RNA polymerase sigma-70 factor, ECF subfamily
MGLRQGVSWNCPVDELHETDDATLAQRAAAGCVESFAALARRYQVPVVHYVRRLVGGDGRGEADDVAQEAFLRAWRRIDRYDRRWAFSTWLFTIARRTWLNQARATRRRRTRETAVVTAGVDESEPFAAAIATERATRLWDVASVELAEPEFTAIWLRYVEEKPLAEIGLVLDKPAATVKVILFRARRRLEPFVRHLGVGVE